jgi:CRISPR/Cas system CSM-associated protein Csm2 small subunit
MNYVKSVACRAAKCERFNDISPMKLRQLYRIFGDRKNKEAEAWVNEELNRVTAEQ